MKMKNFSLHKLKIYIRLPSLSQESHEIATNFIKDLRNIKGLKLSCLFVNKKNLNDLIEAILGPCKKLNL